MRSCVPSKFGAVIIILILPDVSLTAAHVARGPSSDALSRFHPASAHIITTVVATTITVTMWAYHPFPSFTMISTRTGRARKSPRLQSDICALHSFRDRHNIGTLQFEYWCIDNFSLSPGRFNKIAHALIALILPSCRRTAGHLARMPVAIPPAIVSPSNDPSLHLSANFAQSSRTARTRASN